jgi:hypothetical protein
MPESQRSKQYDIEERAELIQEVTELMNIFGSILRKSE